MMTGVRRKRVESIDSISTTKKAKFDRKVKRMNRKDLEELVLEKIVEAIVAKSKLGNLVKQFEKMKLEYNKIKEKTVSLQKQLVDLNEVTTKIKVLEEKKTVRIPKIIRNVGLQVSYEKNNFEEIRKPEVAAPLVDLEETSSNNDHDEEMSTTTKNRNVKEQKNFLHLGHHISEANDSSKKAPEIVELDETVLNDDDDVKNIPSSLLVNQKEDSSELAKDTAGKKKVEVARKSTSNGRNTFSRSIFDLEEKSLLQSEDEPLLLAVKKANGDDGIVISWASKTESFPQEKIIHFELEGSKGDLVDASIKKWSRIGNVIKPLPLPMACNLNNFKNGIRYNFRVKVVTEEKSQYSNVSSIML